MEKTFYETYIEDNIGVIILSIITFFISVAVIINFSHLNGNKIANNFNDRSNYCRDYHNGILKDTVLKDSVNGGSYHLYLCTDGDGNIYADELPSESILHGGDWFDKCRKGGNEVHYYSDNINSNKAITDKGKTYICSNDSKGKVFGAYRDNGSGPIQVG